MVSLLCPLVGDMFAIFPGRMDGNDYHRMRDRFNLEFQRFSFMPISPFFIARAVAVLGRKLLRKKQIELLYAIAKTKFRAKSQL